MEGDKNLENKEIYSLPTLYVIDKRGQERLWKIWVTKNTVCRVSGLVNGKKVPWSRKFTGKNKGRKNETSDEEQAKLEADRIWTKQLDKGYKPKCDEGKLLYSRVMKEKKKSGGVNRTASTQIRAKTISEKANNLSVNLEKEIIPMKAQTWDLKDDKNPNSVLPRVLKYFDFDKGVYVQWKLDGFRCIARLQEDGSVALTSNRNKQYPWFQNLRKEVSVFLRKLPSLDGLDCELYAHSMVDQGNFFSDSQRFSIIQSICGVSRKKPHPMEDQICLYVFDLVDTSGKYNQKERFKLLKNLFSDGGKFPHIKLVETHLISCPEEVNEYHGKFAEQGYEGVIIRNWDLKYAPGKRSAKMRKFKYFMDEEYPIVGIDLDAGVDFEHFVWVCALPGESSISKTFKVKPKGTREEKKEWYFHREEFIGKLLTVKFQEYTEDGIPRFPRGVKFRDSWDL